MRTYILLSILLSSSIAFSQINPAGNVSIGMRSTYSFFDHDGGGLGTGGQFRIRLSKHVNTDWYADYINIIGDNNIRSEYFHIGWSVLYYPIRYENLPSKIQPYVLAGHCFDYNRKSLISDPSNTLDRWGSAVQAGLGAHYHLSPRFDVSLTCQYMWHLTHELEANFEHTEVHIEETEHHSLEGHMLATLSVNYQLFRLWTPRK